MSICLNMIVGPFYEPFLQAAIASCYQLCDEFVFVDTAPGNNPNRDLLDEFKELEDVEIAITGEGKPVNIINMSRGKDKDFSYSAARELARVNTESDWVLRLDADEVLHEKDISTLKEFPNQNNFDSLKVQFIHFMIYPWLYEFLEHRIILMKKNSFIWKNAVHEQPIGLKAIDFNGDIKYFHMGYLRGQPEVLKRWKLYSSIKGEQAWYDGEGVNPNTILDVRIPALEYFKDLEETFPRVLEPALDKMFPEWRDKLDGVVE